MAERSKQLAEREIELLRDVIAQIPHSFPDVVKVKLLERCHLQETWATSVGAWKQRDAFYSAALLLAHMEMVLLDRMMACEGLRPELYPRMKEHSEEQAAWAEEISTNEFESWCLAITTTDIGDESSS